MTLVVCSEKASNFRWQVGSGLVTLPPDRQIQRCLTMLHGAGSGDPARARITSRFPVNHAENPYSIEMSPDPMGRKLQNRWRLNSPGRLAGSIGTGTAASRMPDVVMGGNGGGDSPAYHPSWMNSSQCVSNANANSDPGEETPASARSEALAVHNRANKTKQNPIERARQTLTSIKAPQSYCCCPYSSPKRLIGLRSSCYCHVPLLGHNCLTR